ncbi:galactose oxidase-like domain-containing protein [Pyxidicoccus sp. 3LG]
MLISTCVFALAGPARAQPSEFGQWTHLGTWSMSATHANLLPNGKLFVFGEFEEGVAAPLVWDPVSGVMGAAPVPDYNIFCAGHSFLADGRLLVTGGHKESHYGFADTSIYDFATDSWFRGPDMNDKRWYPTNVTLPNGDVAILSGETEGAGTCNEMVQVYQMGAYESGPVHTLRNLTTAVRDLPYYPRMFVAPNGMLFMAGTRRGTMWLDWRGTGTWYEHGRSLFGARTYGTAVYFDGKVLITGGGDPPAQTSELIDLNQDKPTWRYTASMVQARRQHNATLLPDGTVLVTGGTSAGGFNDSSGAVKAAELFNPVSERWTRLAAARDFHGYHATSVLLPDGRVFHGGGRGVRTAEVFSPPYLFKGPRPTLTSAPSTVEPGTTFSVSSPEAASIRKVTLIGLGSVTHSMDQGQRLLTLSYTLKDGGLDITAPATNVEAPPGPYLLFLVNDKGVPSIGKVVTVPVITPKLQRVISFSDVWKYHDRNVDLGTSWSQPEYDDSGWDSGPGQLGYGDDDEGTVLTQTAPAQPSVYLRRRFTLDKPVTRARIEALFDDGVAVWINGVRVYSRNVNGTDFDDYATASASNEYARADLSLAGNPFRVGENVIAAMVKQVSGTSVDLTFALGLEVELSDAGPGTDSVTVLSPNGGEVLLAGSSVPLRWSSHGSVPTVDLAFSSNLGATWTPIASSVGNTGVYTWQVPVTPTARALVRVSRAGPGTPADTSDAAFAIATEQLETTIPWRSTWKYHGSGTDPGAGWSTDAYDDSAWPSGAGQLGYGDGDEATVFPRTVPSQTSVYFRKKFTVTGAVTSASLSVLYDDGAAVYLNGTQVFLRNIPPTGLAHARYATASVENEVATEVLSPALFVQGENTLAVMVKQNGGTSPDLSFDLSLELGVSVPPPQVKPPKKE